MRQNPPYSNFFGINCLFFSGGGGVHLAALLNCRLDSVAVMKNDRFNKPEVKLHWNIIQLRSVRVILLFCLIHLRLILGGEDYGWLLHIYISELRCPIASIIKLLSLSKLFSSTFGQDSYIIFLCCWGFSSCSATFSLYLFIFFFVVFNSKT